MRYRAFHFENYKGIESMDLALSGDVTTLIGLNESGKTTILEAIFCFSYGAEDLDALDPGMATLRDPESWIPIADRANFNKSIVISATVVLDEQDKAGLAAVLLAEHGLAVKSIPTEIVITESHDFEASRFVRTNRLWSLRIRGVGVSRPSRGRTTQTLRWSGRRPSTI
jgi:predicted ATP-dependent endonuclease of OLD family